MNSHLTSKTVSTIDPDTRESLSGRMLPALIASANREVAKIMEAATWAKRGPYVKYNKQTVLTNIFLDLFTVFILTVDTQTKLERQLPSMLVSMAQKYS